jgi:hypothetical protein
MRFILLVAACAPIQVGKYQLVKDIWEQDALEIKNRAAFEMRCEGELSLTVLAVRFGGGGPNHAKQVGVEGCGKRAVYAQSPQGWALNNLVDR